MLMPLLYPYIKFCLGTLYPAYKTWKALKRKDDTTRRRWMKYWVSYSAFQVFELVADITLAFILPFYIELKLMFLIWLVLGTKLVYDSIVDRELRKREKSIDKWLTRLNKVRNELVALIWFEVSRCSITILTSIMSGGMSVLIKPPIEQSNQPSRDCSDVEEISDHEDDTVHYIDHDTNENIVSMEWSAITLNETNNVPIGQDKVKITYPANSVQAIRKSARREQMLALRSSARNDICIREIASEK